MKIPTGKFMSLFQIFIYLLFFTSFISACLLVDIAVDLAEENEKLKSIILDLQVVK